MNESLLTKLQALKTALENDERILKLKETEEKMGNSEEVQILVYKKDTELTNFEDALKHFGEGSNEVKIAQKRLYEAKLALDEHPLVLSYNLAYKEVRNLYNKINKEIFDKFLPNNRGNFDD